MTLPVTATQSAFFAADHLEQISGGISAFTVEPYKNALYYFFPFLSAFFNGYHQLSQDPTLEAIMPLAPTQLMLKEIEDLTQLAGIKRKVTPYIALNHTFANYGGGFSITEPALLIPEQHLFRRGGNSPFPKELTTENLKEKKWIYSDDETRFLIARELSQIKDNSVIVKVAIKIAVLAALLTIYASPLGWTLGVGTALGSIGIHLFSERFFQARADLIGANILGKKIRNPYQTAIDTLEKMRLQNLYRRENSKLARVYITESGNNVLDLTHPFLTTRIARLSSCL